MVRHGEAPDPKADMMYPDGLGRVISGAGYFWRRLFWRRLFWRRLFRGGLFTEYGVPAPLVISFPANNALQQKHHAACPSTRLGAKYRPAIIK